MLVLKKDDFEDEKLRDGKVVEMVEDGRERVGDWIQSSIFVFLFLY